MLEASAAIGALDKESWSKTKPEERLAILKKIQLNLCNHQLEVGVGDARIKNNEIEKAGNGGTMAFSANACLMSAVVPAAVRINAAIDLYTALVEGKPFQPPSEPVSIGEDLYEVIVSPNSMKEMVVYGPRVDKIRVKGKPVHKGPYDKEPKIVAVLGAGNFNAPYEIIQAVFCESAAVVYKPHPLYEPLAEVWQKILEPLIQAKALAYTQADQGSALTQDPRVEQIFFTGGAEAAKKILEATKTPLVCEAGGVSPTFIVPGDREWTEAELTHHAQQIASGGKFNGGAICARPQMVVTCKQWPQRAAFLQALEDAIRSTTYAEGTYYPGSDAKRKAFLEAYPDAKEIQPEENASECAKVILVTGDKEDGYGSKNEAFCQVFTEVPLDTEPNGTDFLTSAVDYANEKVFGTLVAGIIIDEKTRENHREALDKALKDLKYGTVGINILPMGALFNPFIPWQGHDEEGKVESGRGHFGSAFGYENVEKSIMDDTFVSPAHIKGLNRSAMDGTFGATARFYCWPSWFNLVRLMGTAIPGSMKGKDW